MPIDYKKYPKDWKTKIRPDILKRAEDKCEECGIDNYLLICRGVYDGLDAYQIVDCGERDSQIFNAEDSTYLGSDYYLDSDNNKIIKVVLTIAHLDHDISNNDYSNLKAMCQRCHLNYDKKHHIKNSNATRRNKKNNYEIFST